MLKYKNIFKNVTSFKYFLDGIVKIDPSTFVINDVVNFFLTVRSKKTRLSASAVQKVKFVETQRLFIWIKCIKNCYRNVLVHEIFHARVICDDCEIAQEKIFEWTLNSRIIGNSSQAVIFPYQLKNEWNVLSVKIVQGERIGETSLTIWPLKSPTAKCKISPVKGIEFVTNFTISCVSTALSFEVFQENKLIGKFYLNSMSTKLKAFNSLQLYIYDSKGALTAINLSVFVEKLTIDGVVDNFIMGSVTNSSLHQLIASNDLKSAAIMVQIAIDNIKNEDEKLMEKIIDEVEKILFADAETILIVANIIKQIVEKIETNYLQRAKFGSILGRIALATSNFPELRFDEAINIMEIVQIIIEKQSISIKIMVNQEKDSIPEDQRFDDYEDYEAFDSEIGDELESFLSVGNNIEKVLESLLHLLSKFVEPDEPVIELSPRNQTLFVYGEDFSENSSDKNISLYDTNIIIGRRNLLPHVIVKCALIGFKNFNPFWFVDDKKVKRSNVISLSMFDSKNHKIKKFSNGLRILHRMKPSTAPVYRVCVHNFNDMPVYRLKISVHSRIIIEYKVAHHQNVKYLTQFGKKPQFKDFVLHESYVRFAKASESIQVLTETNYEDFFIAFLPEKSNHQSCTELSLKFYVISCDAWDRLDGSWNKKICTVEKVFNTTSFECLCSQPGSFTATVELPSAWLDPSRKINNILEQNFVILDFVMSIYFTIIVAFVLIRRKNKSKKKIIHVRSNHPDDMHFYIISITTGALKNGGTSSRVCMEIFGSEASSGVLWMNDDETKFTRKSEWDILMSTAASIGNIERIHVWIHPFGYENQWCCERISVFEPSRQKSKSFSVQCWFTLDNDEAKSVHDLAMKENEPKKQRHLFHQNLRNEYVKIFLSSNFKDFKKHFVVLVFIPVISMSVNCFLFGTTTASNVENEFIEFKHFDISRVLRISAASFAIFAAFKTLFGLLFNLCNCYEPFRLMQ